MNGRGCTPTKLYLSEQVEGWIEPDGSLDFAHSWSRLLPDYQIITYFLISLHQWKPDAGTGCRQTGAWSCLGTIHQTQRRYAQSQLPQLFPEHLCWDWLIIMNCPSESSPGSHIVGVSGKIWKDRLWSSLRWEGRIFFKDLTGTLPQWTHPGGPGDQENLHTGPETPLCPLLPCRRTVSSM